MKEIHKQMAFDLFNVYFKNGSISIDEFNNASENAPALIRAITIGLKMTHPELRRVIHAGHGSWLAFRLALSVWFDSEEQDK